MYHRKPSLWDKPLLLGAALILAGEAVLCLFIIRFVPYTEIDWRAYMEQVQYFREGERDYINIRGGTGPLVYPAGFLYIFTFLFELTDNGTNITRAQLMFAAVYIATQILLFSTLGYAALKAGHSPGRVALLFAVMALSRRLHSLYVLRLFNDCFAMLLFHMSIFSGVVIGSWTIACLLFSLAVSVKMSILLFAPGLLIVLLHQFPRFRTIPYLAICAFAQLAMGFPFLIVHPVSYLRKAFELDREFFYIWTVNLKFLPESIFLSKQLAIFLLVGHLCCLTLFLRRHWLKRAGSVLELLNLRKPKSLDAAHIIDILFTSNFIGIVFSRTIHFQFYSWYGHHLPWLLFRTSLPVWAQGVIWLAVEGVYNVYPPNTISSLVLQLSHIILLSALYFKPASSDSSIRVATTDIDKPKPT